MEICDMEETKPEAKETKPEAPKPLPIHLLGSKALRTPSVNVGEITDDIRRLADSMVQTMLRAEGIGLAACQVGVPLRLIVVSNGSVILRLANPEIKEKEGEREVEEGCLSLPMLSVKVKRPKKVLVEAIDVESGSKVLVEATGIDAACMLHEIDHLDGVLILDKVSSVKRDIYERKLRKRLKDIKRGHVHEGKTVREEKVGRNDPCPCESGKKYKKCCGGKACQ